VLQSYSHDGHLYVRYDTKTVKELLTSSDSAAESGGEDAFFHSKEARERNFGFEEVKVLSGNIGYIKLSEINISEKSLPTLFAAVEFVANTKALILDLRSNGGGGSEIGAVLESLFLPKNAKLLEFKTRTGPSTTATTVPWITQKKYEKPLYILISKGTASAAEAFTFALQAHKRAIVVGQRSSGAAHMNSWYVVNDCLYVSVSTGTPTLPGTERSWEGNGIQPDHSVEEGEEIGFILRKIGEK
jgi:C-terminal processing protease CtpA/Prc